MDHHSAGTHGYGEVADEGEAINVENIGRTVTDGFEKVNEYVHSEESRSVLHRIGSGIVAVAGFVIKVCLVILAIVCAPALLICLVVLGAFLMVASGLITAIPAIFTISSLKSTGHW